MKRNPPQPFNFQKKGATFSGSQTLFGNPFMDAQRPATRRRASWKAFPNRIWEREKVILTGSVRPDRFWKPVRSFDISRQIQIDSVLSNISGRKRHAAEFLLILGFTELIDFYDTQFIVVITTDVIDYSWHDRIGGLAHVNEHGV